MLLSRRTLGLALILFACVNVAIIVWWHSANFFQPYAHIDSIIPIAVKNHIHAVRWPDTNWAGAELPDWARYDQFNFSSYILSFTLFERLSPLEDRVDLYLLSILCWGASIAITAWIAGRRLGLLAGAVVFCGMAVTPLLVQDSFYGRPESFLTLISVLVFALSSLNRWSWQLVASIVAGLGLACKISFAPFVAATVAAPLLLRGPAGWARSGLSMPVVAIGFALGAPGAVADPKAFFNGVEYLRTQYSGLHWPHGSVEEGLIQQALHSGEYFVATIGVLGVLLLAAGAAAHAIFTFASHDDERPIGADRLHALAFCVVAFATVIFFSTQRTFFERNVSHAFPILWYSVAWTVAMLASGRIAGSSRTIRIALSALLVAAMIPMSLVSVRIAHFIGGRPGHPSEVEYLSAERLVAEKYPELAKTLSFAWREQEIRPTLCKSLAEANSPTVLKLITGHASRRGARIADSRIELIAAAQGTFDDLPLSTLQTYHSAQVEYYLLNPDIESSSDGCNAPNVRP
jgi:hypothetical protein